MLNTARRAQAVRLALADCASALPTTRQLELLTRYVLGGLTRRRLYYQLDASGPVLRLPRVR